MHREIRIVPEHLYNILVALLCTHVATLFGVVFLSPHPRVRSHPLLVHIRHPSVPGTDIISIAMAILTMLPTLHILGMSKRKREALPPCGNILYRYLSQGWLAVAFPLQAQ